MTAPKLCPWGNLASQLPFCFIWAKLRCFAAESTEEMQFLDALASLEVTAVSDPSFRQVSHVTQVAKVTLMAPVILVTLITFRHPGGQPIWSG